MLQTKMQQQDILRFGYLTSENDRGTKQPKDMNLGCLQIDGRYMMHTNPSLRRARADFQTSCSGKTILYLRFDWQCEGDNFPGC